MTDRSDCADNLTLLLVVLACLSCLFCYVEGKADAREDMRRERMEDSK